MKADKYKFSIIIPIYNVEDYLEETIESVIRQDIGFHKNIQIILVNDGSPDNSEAICLKYKKKYPDNIVYVKQKNAGVSAARNNGMQYVEGKYVNFLDSDDKWSKNTFRDVYNFFEKYYNEIDVVSCRIEFFEARSGYHVLDYKFEDNKNKVVDINEEYSYVQLSAATVFIKADALKGRSFDSRIKYGEDALFINTVILEKCKYGIVVKAIYHYRSRDVGTSAMQNTLSNKSWYFDTTELVLKVLIELSKNKFGRVIEYIQYLVMYDTKWRLKAQVPEGLLTKTEYEEYIKSLVFMLSHIDDHIICEQKNWYGDQKRMTLSMKYGEDIADKLDYDKGKFFYNGTKLCNLNTIVYCVINFIKIENGYMNIEGECNFWIPEADYQIYFYTQEKEKYYVEFFELHSRDRYGVIGLYAYNRGFRVSVPMENLKRLKAIFQYKKDTTKQLKLGFGKFEKLSLLENTYGIYGDYVISVDQKTLLIQKKTGKRVRNFEKAYCKELSQLKNKKMIFYRIAAKFLKRYKKNEIWLLSDRINVARDNGEALFEYICKQKPANISPYFVISKYSHDFKRMKKIGKVIKYDSLKYKLYFLLADKLISAHIDEYVMNAFGINRTLMKNMFQFKYIFLQHGITKDDISGWVNKVNKNISLFITAAKPEYQSILEGDYFYSEKEVALTGFPRFDNLIAKKEKCKKIIIIPTWRRELANEINPKTGVREYSSYFKKSGFFKFYNSLINDSRLLDCMKKHGYTGKFCLHTNHEMQSRDFTKNDVIHINTELLDYQNEFIENDLMLTDFSSVAFDFAYMKKPVIYTHFDKERFFSGQVYDEGYFKYEQDGFGPVCYDYQSTVDALIRYIENDCVLEPDYLERINNFYFATDTNNCKRVYEEIITL